MPLGTCQQECNPIRIIEGRKKTKLKKKCFCYLTEVTIGSSLCYEELKKKNRRACVQL